MKVSELKNLIESVISKEVRNKIISESKEVYHIKCEGVPLGTFDTEEEANEALPSYKEKHDGELIVEKGQYDSHESMIDKLDEMNDELEETDNMENTDMENQEPIDEKLVGKQKNIDKNDNGKIDAEDFKILNKEEECEECGDSEMKEGTCEKCGKKLCECGSTMYESKKKTIRLKESELIKLINKMVTESIPGLDSVKSAHDGDKETKQHLSDVENKMKDFVNSILSGARQSLSTSQQIRNNTGMQMNRNDVPDPNVNLNLSQDTANKSTIEKYDLQVTESLKRINEIMIKLL